jgi:tetratricopeptide (TPR) repeat protein
VLRRLTVVAALLVLAAVPDAWAQRRGGGRSSQPAEDPVRAEARAHFEAGIALMRVQNWEGAQLEFERSMETYPTPSALFNIGMCQKAQFLYVEAMETFERYLATYANEADPAELTELRSMVDELERLLGQITVTVNVTGATVSLDGEDIGTAPLAEPIRVVAGQYAITARLDGYHAAERAVTVTSGDEVDVALAQSRPRGSGSTAPRRAWCRTRGCWPRATTRCGFPRTATSRRCRRWRSPRATSAS